MKYSDGTATIILSDDLKIGSGNGRIGFRHPHDPRLVLKVDTTPVKGRLRWHERPPNIRSSNLREIEVHSVMIQRLGQAEDFVTGVYGWAATNLGPALIVENVHYQMDDHVTLNNTSKANAIDPFDRADVTWARQRYSGIADLFGPKGIYNHGLKPESVVLGRRDGTPVLKLMDFKTIVYRQLISPRFIPGARLAVQKLTVDTVLGRFDRLLALPPSLSQDTI